MSKEIVELNILLNELAEEYNNLVENYNALLNRRNNLQKQLQMELCR